MQKHYIPYCRGINHVQEEARPLHAGLLQGGDRLRPRPGIGSGALCPRQEEQYALRQDSCFAVLRAVHAHAHVF